MPRLFENLSKKRSFGKLLGEGEAGPLGVQYGPIRRALAEFEPVLLKDRPKVFGQQYIADTITKEMAIKATAASPWAISWSEGMLKLAGVSPAEPDYEERKKQLARKVAERLWA